MFTSANSAGERDGRDTMAAFAEQGMTDLEKMNLSNLMNRVTKLSMDLVIIIDQSAKSKVVAPITAKDYCITVEEKNPFVLRVELLGSPFTSQQLAELGVWAYRVTQERTAIGATIMLTYR